MEEDEKVEFRESLDEERTLRTIAAFANQKGGRVFIGIDDRGNAKSANIGKNKLEMLTRRIHDDIHPVVVFDARHERINGKEVLVVEVKEAKRKPVFYNGTAYKRVNKTTLKIVDPEELRNLFENKTIFFDDSICEGASLEGIDEKSVERFANLAASSGRLNASKLSVEEILRKLDLAHESKLKNGAIMLFGKKPLESFNVWGIRCAVLSSGGEFEAIEEFNENIMNSIEKVMDFILQNIRKEMRFEGLRRIETPSIPPEAIREALINAMAHRDYFFPSFIYVSIFPDYLEIKNPGRLEGMGIDDLSKIHPSVIKNARIANVLFLAGYIEKWGSGTLKMINLMREKNLMDPEFASNSMFSVKLFSQKMELNDRERFILKELEKHGRIIPSDISKKMHVSITTAINDLKHLVKLNFAEKVGKNKGSHYKYVKVS